MISRLLLCLGSCLLLLAMESVNLMAGEPVEVPLWSDAELGPSADVDTESWQDRGGKNAWLTQVSRPTLTIYAAESSQEATAAIVICPGGGYGGLAIEKEGYEVARWLASQGVTAGVLKYRCGGGANVHPVPRNDARRAIELMRSNAKDWNIQPDQIGILGFSAGGHLASTIATDDVAAVNFAVLIYPVITMAEGITHGGSRKNLLGEAPGETMVRRMSRDEQVTNATCPTFLVHSGDDKAVPVQNSLRFYAACIENGVPAEMHLYPTGGHGCGMFRGDRPVDQWGDRLAAWMRSNGWMGSPTKPVDRGADGQ